ncbi:hypothetical protein BRD06_11110 [Halobacteriales archaeon QS_9_67_15]|nr:MAG: hypothetical protein BRD06_11110 [Halobacteriales archaeon QS_9_67_15]
MNTSVYHGQASPRQVVVMPKNASEAQVRTLLAHEFVHWLQFHSDVADTSGFGGFVDDTDSSQVAAGLVEGASVYITDAYVERYMNVSWNQTGELRAQYKQGPAGRRLFRARYLYGAQYIHSTVENPRNVSWLYDESTPTPVTSEQLIDGTAPSEEPERNLTLSVNETENWTVSSNHYDTKGEIVVRTMVRAELNRSVASAAADGWGSDHVTRAASVSPGPSAGTPPERPTSSLTRSSSGEPSGPTTSMTTIASSASTTRPWPCSPATTRSSRTRRPRARTTQSPSLRRADRRRLVIGSSGPISPPLGRTRLTQH